MADKISESGASQSPSKHDDKTSDPTSTNFEELPESSVEDVKPDRKDDEEEEEEGEYHSTEDEIPRENQSKIEQSGIEEGEISDDNEPAPKRICRYYSKGKCRWYKRCKFLHPGAMPSYEPKPKLFIDDIRHMPVPPIRKVEKINSGKPFEQRLQSAKELPPKLEERKEQDKDFDDKKTNIRVCGEIKKESSSVPIRREEKDEFGRTYTYRVLPADKIPHYDDGRPGTSKQHEGKNPPKRQEVALPKSTKIQLKSKTVALRKKKPTTGSNDNSDSSDSSSSSSTSSSSSSSSSPSSSAPSTGSPSTDSISTGSTSSRSSSPIKVEKKSRKLLKIIQAKEAENAKK